MRKQVEKRSSGSRVAATGSAALRSAVGVPVAVPRALVRTRHCRQCTVFCVLQRRCVCAVSSGSGAGPALFLFHSRKSLELPSDVPTSVDFRSAPRKMKLEG